MPADEIGPFAATVDGVYNLCPEAVRVTDPNQSGLSTPITEQTVRDWIIEVSAAVDTGIGTWTTLPDEPAGQGVRTGVAMAARTIVHNGVASYLEAARYPTKAALNDSTYAGVLWQRYQDGLAALKARVAELHQLPADEGGGATGGGAYACFPPVYFRDGVAW